MRAKEFVREQRLDELLPALPPAISALAGSALGQAIWAAINAYFLYETLEAIYKVFKENNFEPSKMGLFEWAEVALYAAFAHWGFKASKEAVKTVMDRLPADWKQKLGEFVKNKFEDKVKEKTAQATAKATEVPKTPTDTPTPAQPRPSEKNPNLVDRPFSKQAEPAPKNPNWVEKPYSKN